MRVVIFCHTLRSDWNHGNAHFLRGITSELQRRGHLVTVLEPRGAWSAEQLVRDAGATALDGYRAVYPDLSPRTYDAASPDLDEALDGADLVMVHEWTEPSVVAEIGRRRARGARFALLFHDTHHRTASKRDEIAQLDLSGYDGVLAFGDVIAERYRREGWSRRVWVWHEAADVHVFRPRPGIQRTGDLIWIGNWGDDERTAELHEFLIEPARSLALRGRVHGVRYPADGIAAIEGAGLTFAGWLPNYRVPEAFAAHRVTVHVPRGPYTRELPGIPTIRVFEALACGIPLVSAPWQDVEGLFTPGVDYLVAPTGAAMRRHLAAVLADADMARTLATHGRDTILRRHTCAHRVDELLAVAATLIPAPCEAV